MCIRIVDCDPAIPGRGHPLPFSVRHEHHRGDDRTKIEGIELIPSRLLTEQLLEIMPELKEVSGWPAVGHRRRADEVGRIGENPISEDWLHEAS